MRTAIYIENGLMQLVLTPEDEFEKSTLKTFNKKDMDVCIKEGSFYKCQGGYVRQSSDESLFITAKETPNETK